MMVLMAFAKIAVSPYRISGFAYILMPRGACDARKRWKSETDSPESTLATC
jgi:hypothetical protein